MTGQSEMLPSFERPPVIETVLGIFFRPLRGLDSVRQGIFWREVLQKDFPDFEIRAPIDEVAERFDADLGRFQPGIRWQVSSQPETPRLWAMSESGEHILQLQRNALLANWLRRGEYRPFEQRLAGFEQRYQQVEKYFALDDPFAPVSATVTYINHVPLEHEETWPTAVQRTLTYWSNPQRSWLPVMDRGVLQFSFAFPADGGRLHATITPAKPKEAANACVQIELTGRIMIPKENQTATQIVPALRTVHEWVVRGFADLTRPEMHAHWGRIR